LNTKAQADALREVWKTQYLQNQQVPGEVTVDPAWQSELGLVFTLNNLAILELLPAGSFLIYFAFRLKQPYLSKDSSNFHIIDNSIVRDKVFRWPEVRTTSWKGALYHAFWQLGHDKEDEPQMQRIFGNIRANDQGQAGRLHFYSTFFNKTSLEIINPHNRKTRTGKNPILLESVPAGATGTFTLLYVPFDRVGEDEAEMRRQVAEDLKLVAEGVQAMMTLYGFGAKTSSGFGVATEQLNGEGAFVLNYPDVKLDERPPRPAAPAPPQQPPALHTYLAEFPNEDFALKPDEWRKRRNATNSQREAYKDARAARQKYQQTLTEHEKVLAHYQEELSVWESTANTPPLAQTKRTFANFVTMVSEIVQVVQQLSQGGEQ
jgi:CRISPR-associated protein Cmr2